MDLFNKALQRIEDDKHRKATGEQLCVPYPYPRLDEILGGVDKGQAIGIVGATGTGKSKWTRYTYLYSVYKFYKETGYKVRILWFCMEDQKEQTFDFVLCNYLKEQKNILVTHKELHSRKKELPQFVLDEIRNAKVYFADFFKIVTFIDGITEPSELYGICRQIALNMGKVNTWMENIDGKEVKQYNYECDTHVIAVFDNMSNIDTEDGTSNEQAAILKFVKEYMRLKLCNFFRWTCVMVMQLDFESERQAFSRSGETILAKIEPSLASIGDSKRSSRSFHLIFSLFDPSRYELIHYPIPSKQDPENCYRIDVLSNRFRALKILKSNGTETGKRIGLYFDAIGERFDELPQPKTEELKSIYQDLTKNSLNKFVNQKQSSIFVPDSNNEEKIEDPF
jgi:hypothetical protein